MTRIDEYKHEYIKYLKEKIKDKPLTARKSEINANYTALEHLKEMDIFNTKDIVDIEVDELENALKQLKSKLNLHDNTFGGYQAKIKQFFYYTKISRLKELGIMDWMTIKDLVKQMDELQGLPYTYHLEKE